MKTSIIKSEIDINELNRAIYFFRSDNDKDPDLFMNDETIESVSKQIWQNCNSREFYELRVNHWGIIATYNGMRVYENNDLKYGEVELR